MVEHLSQIIVIEKIMSINEIGDIQLQPIVDTIIQISSPLNVLSMLQLSCEYDNYDAQATYLSIISECSRVFFPYVDDICSLRSSFKDISLYYYCEFILASCEPELYARYIEGIVISETDLAYPFFLRLNGSP